MKIRIKAIWQFFLPQSVLDNMKLKKNQKKVEEWVKAGKPVPAPHVVKQFVIQEYQKKYNCEVLVETGTFLGDMVEAQKGRFKKIISIELGVDLFEKAKNRFKSDKHILIVQGDSGKVLPQIISGINEPALFWLDGHYSAGITAKGDKECPIFEEIDAIFDGKKLNHVLLIDDARCFTGEGDYPTIENLTKYVKNKNERYQVETKDDIIRFTV